MMPIDRVEDEDAAPPDVLGQDAAEGGTDREADRGDAGPDADGARLLVRIGERGPDKGERRDVHDRRTDPLEPAHDTQELDARREPRSRPRRRRR